MKGLIHIYSGHGKGKTTAAVGLGIRACGSGLKVLMVQFLKSMDSGEIHVLKRLYPDFRVRRSSETMKFTWDMDENELRRAADVQNELLGYAIDQSFNSKVDLLILDEVLGALECNLIKSDKLRDFLSNKPEHLEVVLTGRNATEEFIDMADYVSEIREVKHPYTLGIKQRKGIEY